ncbi:unnamed protein product [Symbiodinium natans]|uniref:Uncharacterized protein n=1 Tax=Symbiodinium natans TaxID=878477 RepID=A0A812G115_9DINO|nr:unnamed protein product [Symbiodinium natans]
MLVELMVDDLSACNWLLECGILPALMNELAGGGAAGDDESAANVSAKEERKDIVGCILQSLSRSVCFVKSACAEDVLSLCVALASKEVHAVSADGALKLPALECLYNMCHVYSDSIFRQDLATSGVVEVLCEAVRLLRGNRRIRAAESLCNLLGDADSTPKLATATFYYAALPDTVRSLIDLALPNKSTAQAGKACDLFRRRLPWLLLVIACAAPIDLKLWCEESVGVRRLLGDCLSGYARYAVLWALDIIVAMCRCVSAAMMSEFVIRSPTALVGRWSQLVRHEWHSIAYRAAFIGVFCITFMPNTAATLQVEVATFVPQPLSSMPWRTRDAPAERNLAKMVIEIVLELQLRDDAPHARALNPRKPFLNVFLAAAGLDALLLEAGSARQLEGDGLPSAHRDKLVPRLVPVLILLCTSLGACREAMEQEANERDIFGCPAAVAVSLLTSILSGPLKSLVEARCVRQLAEEAHATRDAARISSLLHDIRVTTAQLLEHTIFQSSHGLQPFSEDRSSVQPLLELHEVLLSSHDLGRFLARLIFRVFSENGDIVQDVQADSPSQWRLLDVPDSLMTEIEHELGFSRRDAAKSAVCSPSCLHDAAVQHWTATMLAKSEVCFQTLCTFLAGCSCSVATTTLACLAINSSRLALCGLHLSMPTSPRSTHHTKCHAIALLHLAASRFAQLFHPSSSSPSPEELQIHDITVQLLFTESECEGTKQHSYAEAGVLAEVFAYLWGVVQVALFHSSVHHPQELR